VSSSPVPAKVAPSYAEHAESVLRRLILEGVFRPGQKLNEVDLSQSLEVSRGPLREAFQRLAKEGIISLVRNRGAFVAEFNLEQVEQLYEVRIALEVGVARLAAHRADEYDLSLMQQAIVATRFSLENDSVSYPPDLDFHNYIVASVHNPVLAAKVTEVDSKLRVGRARVGFLPARAVAAYDEHVAIYSAIAARDADRAGTEMRKHLENCLANTLRVLQDLGDGDPVTSHT